MSNQLITKENNERVKSFFSSLDRLSSLMERLFTGKRPALDGESFYTDRELAKKLKVSRRSLQNYRNEGRIPYIKLGGKINRYYFINSIVWLYVYSFSWKRY